MSPDPGSLAARVAAAGRRCSPAGSLLAGWGTRGTPRQAGHLAEYLEAECASRDASRRAQMPGKCALPQAKVPDGYDRGSVAWPDSLGRGGCRPSPSPAATRTSCPWATSEAAGRTCRGRRARSAVSRCARRGSSRRPPWSCGPARLARAGPPGTAGPVLLPPDAGGARPPSRAVPGSYERQSPETATDPGSGRWGTVFGDDQMAAAAVDRVCHHGRLLRSGGESRRAGHAPVSGEGGGATAAGDGPGDGVVLRGARGDIAALGDPGRALRHVSDGAILSARCDGLPRDGTVDLWMEEVRCDGPDALGFVWCEAVLRPDGEPPGPSD